jgi:hypothetical protein
LINIEWIFGRLEGNELFDDGYFVNLPQGDTNFVERVTLR